MKLPRIGSMMRWMVIAVALFLGGALPIKTQEPYFPESVFFPKDKELNEIVVHHLTLQLKAMREPSLWKLSRRDNCINSYRFLWLATNEHPICVRLSQSGKTFTLHVARHDGSPGLVAGRLTLNKEVIVSGKTLEKLIIQFHKTSFWMSPVEVKQGRGMADGDRIVLEGVKSGKYHVIDRVGSRTRETYKRFCRSLLELADPAVLKDWDRFRQAERKEPGYRPEPPETEDQGEIDPDEKDQQ